MTPAANAGAGSARWGRRRLLATLSALVFARSAKAATATVEIRQLAFVPADIEIAAGDTVAFVNLDMVPHTATGQSFDTGTLRANERKEIAFPKPGEFQYLCRFHRHMTGRVVVR